MSPALVDGVWLGVEHNGVFTTSNTEAIPGGRLWNGSGSWAPRGDLGAAQSWKDMRDYIAAKHGAWIGPGGSASSARSFAQQQGLRTMWCGQGHCEKAALPGTSNHGWGIAVDDPMGVAQAMLLRYGPMFGWSHDEGARVGEPWHFRYVGGYRRRIATDPLTAKERRLLNAYAGASVARRDRILDWIAHDIRSIRRHARAQQRGGWGTHRRGARYQVLARWFDAQVPAYLQPDERKAVMASYGASAEHRAAALAWIAKRVRAVREAARHEGWDRHARGARYRFLSELYNRRHR